MSSTNLHIILRSLWKNKAFSIINILGLTLGISCCIIGYVVIDYELTFDAFHSKADRIYRLTQQVKTAEGVSYKGQTPYPLAGALRRDLSGIETITVTHYYRDEFFEVNGEQFEEKGILFAAPEFFSLFDFNWQQGTPYNALSKPNSVVLTRSLEKKYFGESSGIGRSIKLSNLADVTVTGILEDPPNNTNLPFSMVISYATFEQIQKNLATDWHSTHAGTTYLSLQQNTSFARVEQQLGSLKNIYFDAETASKITYSLQPLRDVHTNSLYGHGLNYTAPAQLIWALGMLGFLILLIVCINFINLATAHAIKRTKEVGIRKVLGASKLQLVTRQLLETGLLTTIALLLGLALSWYLLPFFNNYLSFIRLDLQLNSSVISFSVLLIAGVTLTAGLLPALIAADYNVIDILKNKISAERTAVVSIRKVLIITQFVFCQVFLVSMFIIHRQMDFLKAQDLGFAHENILIIDLPEVSKLAANKHSSTDLLLDKLLLSPEIESVSFFSTPPNRARYHTLLQLQGAAGQAEAQLNYVDDHYLETFEIKLLAGQNLFAGATTDSGAVQQLLINQQLLHKLGFTHSQEALGKQIKLANGISGEISGVVEDFHNNTLKEFIEPQVLIRQSAAFRQVGVKLSSYENTTVGAGVSGIHQYISSSWKEVYPNEFLSYAYFDDLMAHDYVAEELIYRTSQLFSFIAIFIGCLGLYGLVAYMTVRRTKEIAVRKVLGASSAGVFMLLSKDFIQLVGIAFLIALPIGYVVMRLWLQNFAYGVSPDLLSFLLAFIVTAAVAFLCISQASFKAAVMNPAASLKND